MYVGNQPIAFNGRQVGELPTLTVRFMQPDSSESERDEFVLVDTQQKFYEASHDFRFAATVASFGMLLRGSEFTGNMTYAAVEEIASQSIGGDASGYRAEFIDLVRCLTSESGK